jgi:hypothetical protein
LTRLGKPQPGNGRLEVKGDDKIKVSYIDEHTADKKFDQKVIREVEVVGDGMVSVTDGAFNETLQGVVLGKSVNVQIADLDRDLTDGKDQIKAIIEVYRRKTDEEIELETAELINKSDSTNSNSDEDELQVDPLKRVDWVEITLVEAKVERIVSNLSTSDDLEKPAETKDVKSAQPTTKPKSD